MIIIIYRDEEKKYMYIRKSLTFFPSVKKK